LISNRSHSRGSENISADSDQADRAGRANQKRSIGMKARVCLLGAAAVGAMAVPAAASASTTYLIGSGSSAAQPYMEALFSAYGHIHKNIRFRYNPDGGNAGVKDVQNGNSEFAIQTAPPVAANAGTTFYKLFRDALCIDVNSKNKVSSLSITQTRDIFEGDFTNWGQVSKSSGLGSQAISPQGRNTAAGQYTYFVSAVLNGGKEASDVTQLTSDGLVKNAVVKDKDAIGYVGLANSAARGEKAVKIGGKACNRANVKSEKYPLWRYDWAVLPKSHQNTQVVAFFNWVIHSAAAGKVINKAGAVAAFNS
jgi:phosphate transport system substrate-binding protein